MSTATETPDLLAAMVAAARRAAAVRAAAQPAAVLEELATAAAPGAQRFHDALARGEGVAVIAECKRRSPSRGILRGDYNPAAIARAYARAGAAAVSVLTEPTFFDGTLEDLRSVRAAVDVPILRKDFVVTKYQLLEARAAGADATLLIVRALEDSTLRELIEDAGAIGLAALVEVHDAEELGRALEAGATIVGVNSRDLRTLEVDRELPMNLASFIPPGVIAVAESGVRTRADLVRLGAAGYHACLVGESLMTAPDPGAALRALRGQ